MGLMDNCNHVLQNSTVVMSILPLKRHMAPCLADICALICCAADGGQEEFLHCPELSEVIKTWIAPEAARRSLPAMIISELIELMLSLL